MYLRKEQRESDGQRDSWSKKNTPWTSVGHDIVRQADLTGLPETKRMKLSPRSHEIPS